MKMYLALKPRSVEFSHTTCVVILLATRSNVLGLVLCEFKVFQLNHRDSLNSLAHICNLCLMNGSGKYISVKSCLLRGSLISIL